MWHRRPPIWLTWLVVFTMMASPFSRAFCAVVKGEHTAGPIAFGSLCHGAPPLEATPRPLAEQTTAADHTDHPRNAARTHQSHHEHSPPGHAHDGHGAHDASEAANGAGAAVADGRHDQAKHEGAHAFKDCAACFALSAAVAAPSSALAAPTVRARPPHVCASTTLILARPATGTLGSRGPPALSSSALSVRSSQSA